MARLKVFRTAIGFHDAYVAAPSQKAALAAWDTDKNLFARGAAEEVTDPELTRAPLAAPGEVIRRVRGNLAEHLAAAGSMPRKRQAAKVAEPREEPPASAASPRPRPAPSRAPVAKAEATVAAFEKAAQAEMAALRQREDALRRERERLRKRHETQAKALAARLDRARTRYAASLDRWRNES